MYDPGGSWRRSQLGWLLVLALLLFFFCARAASPQDSSASKPSALIESLQMRLQIILAYSESLEAELQNWKQLSSESAERARQLYGELQTLRSELEIWQSASGDLQKQVQALSLLYQESESRLKQVLESSRISSDSWRTALEAAARRERRLKFTVVLAAVAAALAGGGIGYLAGR